VLRPSGQIRADPAPTGNKYGILHGIEGPLWTGRYHGKTLCDDRHERQAEGARIEAHRRRGPLFSLKPNGRKLWRLNYAYLGKQRTLSFGAWPDVGLADARERRDQARKLIAAGFDPSHEATTPLSSTI